MAINWFSFAILTVENSTQDSEINKIKTQRWILGMIIGSAPFLLLVICWVLSSICTNSITKYYQYMKKRHRHVKKKTINVRAIRMVAV